MDSKTTLLIVVVVVGEQLGRRFIHPLFGLAFVPMVVLVQFLYSHIADRGSRRRLAAIKALPEDQQRAAADALTSEDDRVDARLALGLVDPLLDGPQPDNEEVFSYSRSKQRSAAWTYWLCLGMAAIILAIGYAQNVAARDDFLPWLGLMVGFGGVAAVMRWLEGHWHTSVFVNVSGVGSIDPAGRRRIILWSQLTAVLNRRWLTQVDFHGVPGTRKISASYELERFPRLMELVSARLRELEGREYPGLDTTRVADP